MSSSIKKCSQKFIQQSSQSAGKRELKTSDESESHSTRKVLGKRKRQHDEDSSVQKKSRVSPPDVRRNQSNDNFSRNRDYQEANRNSETFHKTQAQNEDTRTFNNKKFENRNNKNEQAKPYRHSYPNQKSNYTKPIPSSRRYSANNRLQNLRRGIETNEVLYKTRDNSLSNSVPFMDSQQHCSLKGSEKSNYPVVPSPSSVSVQDRLKKYKSGYQNEVPTKVNNKTAISVRDNSQFANKNLTPTPFKPSTLVSPTERSVFSNNMNFSIQINTSVSQTLTENKKRNVQNSLVHSSTSTSLEDDMSMDWSPISETVIMSDLQELRKSVSNNVNEFEITTQFQQTIAKNSTEIPYNKTILQDLYIIVDTNIFISYTKVIKEIMKLNINGVEVPTVLIPWMVIQELDYMKDGKTYNKLLQNKAQEAVKFINAYLIAKDPRIKGQSVMDAARPDICSKNGDDSILNCCLQVKHKRNRAILLSNDINLRNKAWIHDIPAYSNNEILNALDPFSKTRETSSSNETQNNFATDIKTTMGHLLTFIILKEIRDAYGSEWNKMGLMQKPPWNFEECVERLKKYWIAVFSLNLPKQCSKTIEDCRTFLKSSNTSGKTYVHQLIDICMNLCVYLQNGYPSYKEHIKDAIKQIQNFSEKL